MKRRDFSKSLLAFGVGAQTTHAATTPIQSTQSKGDVYLEPAKPIPVRHVDVVVAGGGTAGVVAALAAARQGVKVMLIEKKGYTGGAITEGGTALHSFFNLWKPFGVEKRQVVRGIPQEIIDRMLAVGGCTGHGDQVERVGYDSVCTAIDTELYKMVAHSMLDESGVWVAVNTLLVGAIMDGPRIKGVISESRSGREAVYAKAFVDCTAYGDLSAHAGADYTEPNDYAVCNSFGVGNVDIDKYYDFLKSNNAVTELAYGIRNGKDNQVVRLNGNRVKLGDEFSEEAGKIGMSMTTTTVHEKYIMFIKMNTKMAKSPTDRDETAKTELKLRKNQYRAVQLFRKFVPGCENAFIARTAPSLNIRRARYIVCDYDITHEDIVDARHFDDEIMVYGFHDMAPGLQVKNGGTYGLPYRALRVAGVENLLASGMLITSDHRAHMSTRNTVCSMGQGQASGTAAALCAKKQMGTRDLKYADLRDALDQAGVYFET